MALLDELLRLFGTSRVQLAWRWRRLRERTAQAGRVAENRSRAYAYEHKTCRECGHPAGKDEARCGRCGGRLVGRTGRNLGRALDVVWPREAPVVTLVLVALCAGLYLLTLQTTAALLEPGEPAPTSPAWPAVFRHGGLMGFAVTELGQWWRLVTACFLHLSLSHLVMNGVGLWVAGQAVEARFGRARALFLYVATGVLGFVASLLWYGPGYAGAGASGAIFGLIGAMIGHALRYRGRTGAEIRARFVPWAIYGLILGFAMPNVDNAAHLGGLLSGLALGALLGDVDQVRRWPRPLWTAIAVTCALLIAASFLWARGGPA